MASAANENIGAWQQLQAKLSRAVASILLLFFALGKVKVRPVLQMVETPEMLTPFLKLDNAMDDGCTMDDGCRTTRAGQTDRRMDGWTNLSRCSISKMPTSRGAYGLTSWLIVAVVVEASMDSSTWTWSSL